MKSDLVFILHVLEAIEDIESSLKDLPKEIFFENKDLRDATIRRIEIIGEATKNISSETKNNYSEIKWKEIMGTRDRLIHAYFRVNLEIMWDIVNTDIPILKKQIINIKRDLEKIKDKFEKVKK